MKKLLAFLIIIYLLAAGTYYVRSYSNPCGRTLTYSIGTYDPRFGVTEDQFKKIIQEMEKVWEEPTGINLFQYEPDSKFKINLVFDDRQQKTIEERALRSKIDIHEASYDQLVAQFNSLTFQHKAKIQKFEQQKQSYEKDLENYNQQVSYWNSKGGAPSDDYKKLNAQKTQLNSQAAQLETQRREINLEVRDLNELADRINAVAKTLNLNVDAYNGKYGTSRRFDQGTYTGNSINIFQFNEEADLRLVVAHELGHALKLEHVDTEPTALMYYLMDKQDLANIKATDSDLMALRTKCGLE